MDWTAQNAVGRDEAHALVKEIRRSRNTVILGFRIKRMITAGYYGGVEVGFCHALSEHLLMPSPLRLPAALHPILGDR
jgi:hypothetical protein